MKQAEVLCWSSCAFKLSENLLFLLGVGQVVEIIGRVLRFLHHAKVLSIRREQYIINFTKVSHYLIYSYCLINKSIPTCLTSRSGASNGLRPLFCCTSKNSFIRLGAKRYYGVIIEGARGPRLHISTFYIYILVAVHCPTAELSPTH